uniref:Uncharacterized protein n=1 Tax=viral metagenome TaxID=1070528 RepID=A0A6C0J2W3_9ZZZZ
MSISKEVASNAGASREDKDTPNIKDTYLSMDGIPPTITIHERSDGIPPTIVQFTSGHRFDDKSALQTNNFAWDKVTKTYVRISAKGTCLTSLLKTYAINPQYIMPDNDADELKGHCLITPRGYKNGVVCSDINSALSKSGFKWSMQRRAWIKKMKRGNFRNDIMNFFKKTPQRVCHQGTDEEQDAKQNIKKVRKEQRNYEIQCDNQDMKFEQERNYFMYRVHKADSDPDYQRASYSYGQHIKQLAAQGIYDYPDPPKLPRYR